MRIGFIGAGAVGTALAVGLSRAGERVVAVASRRHESARRLAASIPGCRAEDDPQAVVDAADLVFLAVPDDAIADCAAGLGWRPGVAAVHCSGAHSTDILAPVAAGGGRVGGFHPLQTFAGGDPSANLPGSAIAVEAEEPLLSELAALATALGGTVIRLRSGDKPLYHAAAVIVSNYAVTLMQVAADLWAEFGVSPEAATRALLPLLQGTVNNLGRVGLPSALTGPIARGDTGTVRRHLAALGEWRPEALAVYRTLGQATVPIARAKGSIDPERAPELLQVLDGAISRQRSAVGREPDGAGDGADWTALGSSDGRSVEAAEPLGERPSRRPQGRGDVGAPRGEPAARIV